MQFFPIKTRPLLPPQDNVLEVIDASLKDIQEGDMVFITSKVVTIHEGTCIKNDGKITKKELIRQEADSMLEKDVVPGKDIYLTIKHNILIPSAGIDESNANGYFILYPKDCLSFCKEVHQLLCKKFAIRNLGVIITDSTTRPLRWGVSGIAIYSYGIVPLLDKRGQQDIFGKTLEVTQIDVIDALAGSAVYLMGEADDLHPIVIGRDIPGIIYDTDESLYKKMHISMQEDIYGELLKDKFL